MLKVIQSRQSQYLSFRCVHIRFFHFSTPLLGKGKWLEAPVRRDANGKTNPSYSRSSKEYVLSPRRERRKEFYSKNGGSSGRPLKSNRSEPGTVRKPDSKGISKAMSRDKETSDAGKDRSGADGRVNPFGFGQFSGLTQPEESDVKRVEKLLEKINTFEELKITNSVRQVMVNEIKNKYIYKNPNKPAESVIVRPTPIQVAAIKAIQAKRPNELELRTFTIAAETGSGKTWAYLAPMLTKLKEEELKSSWELKRDKPLIRSVILLPTHELVDQVTSLLESVAPKLDLNHTKWGAGDSFKVLIDAFRSRIDVLITTPGKLLSLNKIRNVSHPERMFHHVKYVAVDEADTLMDLSWVDDTYSSIKLFPNCVDLVFCSATIPREFNKTMQKLFPNALPVSTPALHRIPRTIDFKLINADLPPYKGSKTKALAQALYAIQRDGTEPGFEKRVIVFVNEKKTVPYLAEKLANTYNHDVTSLIGEDDPVKRREKINVFLQAPRQLDEIEREIDMLREQEISKKGKLVTKDTADSKNKIVCGSENSIKPNITEESIDPRRDTEIESDPTKMEQVKGVILSQNGSVSNKLKVLITTDVLARGLNFVSVKNVILYDVPTTAIDLVHRAGRTGRMKQSGRVFMIISGSSTRTPWVRGLPRIIRNGVPLT